MSPRSIFCAPLWALVFALASLIVAPRASADIIPDGYRGVDHQVVIEGVEQFPDLRFALYPTFVTGRNEDVNWTEVTTGTPLHWYKLLSPKLYAWPAANGPPKDSRFFEGSNVPRSDLELERVSVVKISDPAHALRSVYRITGVDGSSILLKLESVSRYDSEDRLITTSSGGLDLFDGRYRRASMFGIFALASLAGLYWLRRRLTYPATKSTPPLPPQA